MDRSILFLLFFLAIVAWSPAITGLVGIGTGHVYLFPTLMLLFLVISKYKIVPIDIILLALVYISLSLLLLFTQSRVNISRFMFFGATLLICYKFARDSELVDRFVTILSWYSVVAILFSWIGFFYALNGGTPFIDLSLSNGRPFYLYLTTFSSQVFGSVIRASFLYDEPGALSFVLCMVVISREMMQRSRLRSILILLGGLVTFSFIHTIILALYVILFTRWGLKILSCLAVSILIGMTYSNPNYSFYYGRFGMLGDIDKNIGFSNRTSQLENFSKAVSANPEILLLGDYLCHEKENARCEEDGDISSSPVSPIYWGGIWLFLIQAITHLSLAFILLRRKYFFETITLSLLLLQRPYFAVVGYGFLIYIPLFYMFLDTAKMKIFLPATRGT